MDGKVTAHLYRTCVLMQVRQTWVQKIKGQYMNRSTFWMIKYMNGSVFSNARYMNGVGFEILAHTPVPKLPLSYPAPPPPSKYAGIVLYNLIKRRVHGLYDLLNSQISKTVLRTTFYCKSAIDCFNDIFPLQIY